MIDTIRKLLVVSRPISWLNTAFPFAVGYLLVFQTVDLRFVLGTLFFLIPYNLLMYGVNDVYDYESDMRNPRKGGIEGAKSGKSLHRSILIASTALSLPFVAALLVLSNLAGAVTLLVVMFFVLAYSVPKLRFKEIPFVDSFTSSTHFVGPLLYTLALGGFPDEAWPYVTAFFLWGMASHAFGAVQDVVADRQGGIASIATVLGGRFTVRFSMVLYCIASIVLLVRGLPDAVVGLVGLAYVANIWTYRTVTDETAESSNKAWRRFIYLNLFAGFVVTMVILYTRLT